MRRSGPLRRTQPTPADRGAEAAPPEHLLLDQGVDVRVAKAEEPLRARACARRAAARRPRAARAGPFLNGAAGAVTAPRRVGRGRARSPAHADARPRAARRSRAPRPPARPPLELPGEVRIAPLVRAATRRSSTSSPARRSPSGIVGQSAARHFRQRRPLAVVPGGERAPLVLAATAEHAARTVLQGAIAVPLRVLAGLDGRSAGPSVATADSSCETSISQPRPGAPPPADRGQQRDQRMAGLGTWSGYWVPVPTGSRDGWPESSTSPASAAIVVPKPM